MQLTHMPIFMLACLHTSLMIASVPSKIATSKKTLHAKKNHKIVNIETLGPVTVRQGEEFMINRPASPNFGRTWKLHKQLPLSIEQVDKTTFIPAKNPGRYEGALIFTFKALQPGMATIEFEKVYPPELKDKKPAKIKIVPVEIKRK